MKAITIWQPYAQAIALGLKKYETRGWSTRHRGLVAIHASARRMTLDRMALAHKYNMDTALPYGKIIVICELTDCVLMTDELIRAQPKSELDFGDWRPGRYAWKLRVVKILKPAPTAHGRQGLWTTDLL